MLEPELIIGIKVLAKVHSGEIEVNCSNCDEGQKERLHCNKASDEVVFTDDDEDLGDFTCCPLNFITKEIHEWWDEYLYYQTFAGTAPRYGFHSNRFWNITKIYKHEYDSSSARMIKKPRKDSSDKELQSLRNNFRKKQGR